MLSPPLGKSHSFHQTLRVFVVLKRSRSIRFNATLALALGDGCPGHRKGLLVLLGVRGGEKQALLGEPAAQPAALQQGVCSSVSDSAASVSPFVKGGNSVSLPPCLGFGVQVGSSPEFLEEKTLPGQLIVPRSGGWPWPPARGLPGAFQLAPN